MEIKAQKVNKSNFKQYGKYYAMRENDENVSYTRTDNFEDHMTKKALIDTPAHLGMTRGKAAPYTVKSMEKHQHTQEAIFCTGEDIILVVASSQGEDPPNTKDLRAFILEPGDVAIIERNVWHDACRGIGKSVNYYYLATPGEFTAQWINIEGESTLVQY